MILKSIFPKLKGQMLYNFNLYKVLKTGESIETERRKLVARDWGKGCL